MNLSIFNFKKLPRAAILAGLIIALVEIGAWSMLRLLEHYNQGGDLLRLETKTLLGIARTYPSDIPADKRYAFLRHNSIKEVSQNSPYDVIVFGSSIGEQGWVEMLRIDYGFKIYKSTLMPSLIHPLCGIIPVIANYNKINGRKKAVLLYADITERQARDFKNLGEPRKDIYKYRRGTLNVRNQIDFPSKRLFLYLESWVEGLLKPMVKKINIHNRQELFYLPDFKELYSDARFNSLEYSKLSSALKEYKDVAAETGCVLAIAIFPTKSQSYEWLINQAEGVNLSSPRTNLRALEKAARENNIPFLDLEAGLEPIAKDLYKRTSQMFWNRAESHMNQLGTRCAAEIIKSFLKEINPNL